MISTVPGLLVPGGTGAVKGAVCSPEIGGMGEGEGAKKRSVETDLGEARLKVQFPPKSPGLASPPVPVGGSVAPPARADAARRRRDDNHFMAGMLQLLGQIMDLHLDTAQPGYVAVRDQSDAQRSATGALGPEDVLVAGFVVAGFDVGHDPPPRCGERQRVTVLRHGSRPALDDGRAEVPFRHGQSNAMGLTQWA